MMSDLCCHNSQFKVFGFISCIFIEDFVKNLPISNSFNELVKPHFKLSLGTRNFFFDAKLFTVYKSIYTAKIFW